MNNKLGYLSILFLIFCLGCKQEATLKESPESSTVVKETQEEYLITSMDILNYVGTPKHKKDKEMLMFSDQGAWFAYSIPDSITVGQGFSGPFLMTQQNGVWSSAMLSQLLIQSDKNKPVKWSEHTSKSYASHLEQQFVNNNIELTQELIFSSGHTAIQRSTIQNVGATTQNLLISWSNQPILADRLSLSANNNEVTIRSSKTDAIGHILFPREIKVASTDSSYVTSSQRVVLEPNQSKEIVISQTFIFSNYSWDKEKLAIIELDCNKAKDVRKNEKNNQLKALTENININFKDYRYKEVIAKSHLTLQNNWRIPAGEIKYEGLFPSYHYKWFNGFWSWDSWKHAVGLAFYNIDLAKKQVKLMFEFQDEDGFVADCVYRDTSIENHNYRDTKPPLSAWAVVKIFEKDKDINFVEELYPKLKKYHYWWYENRDHDQDGICEYGSTDGSLVAAKWESGMDNAIRFDNSKILKNSEGAYSLNQESVDLNAYLFAEKHYLIILANALNHKDDVKRYTLEAKKLKSAIQEQFYDTKDRWFYDTNLEGTDFVKGEGSEGWTALWANVATKEQAEAVKNRMMDPNKFYTKVPFQTMSADHPKFDPLKGYWRGPNWLDQAYFGVRGLRNYGFDDLADKATKQIIEGAEGILGKGKAIRENYHPITGEGLHAHNFSWSAAHILMLIMKD
ncbi:trehalase family glycosidase [Aquimarina sp. 2201CG1-2-11]|uniref:MGH1-like glycoside hydrolase domain-containing protein n=1 Tax=Aquimarina discodermiae TaxID=3231043 RepID=UPI003461C46A